MNAALVRGMREGDWVDVEAIYAQGIRAGNATFETATPSWAAFDAGKLPAPRLVAELDGHIVGWIAASPVSAREVYRGVVEHSVYVDDAQQGRGVGGMLLATFLDAAEETGIWTVQSSIFPENLASLRLHERCGFRVVGRRERIARSEAGPFAGRWRDTVLIERRSTRIGTM